MTKTTFSKALSANDVGTTGGHMGGILIPKGEGELLAFLPRLDSKTMNSSAWINCRTEEGLHLRFRYIYYNNKMHVPTGTRNEYRITHMTKYLRDAGAREGDLFQISRIAGEYVYGVRVVAANQEPAMSEVEGPIRIKLSGWRKVH
jgi:Restriction endonuclease EcoRII, N-terminal